MRIAIIGTGNVGGTLGKSWAKLGHDVFYGVQNPNDEKTIALLRETGSKAQAGTPAEAVVHAEIVVFATPWKATQAAVKSVGDLTGKIVIDCTNPLKADLSGLEVGHTTSGAEMLAEWTTGARVVKAFNTTGFNIMAEPVVHGIPTVMLVCGDDEPAKRVVLELATQMGFDAVDAGPLTQARLLEPWAMMWIYLAYKGNVGRDYGFAMIRR